MTMSRLTVPAAALAALALTSIPAVAVELDGAWATDVKVCDQVFAKKGSALSFRKGSELHGSGFIIDRNRIRGPAARCEIKSRKEDGAVTHLLASCATDLMLSSIQFSVKRIDDNTISRLFPGMEGMEVSYYRCRL